jgi:hypothetical protein
MLHTVNTQKRGCGWRQEGGLYMVTAGEPQPCGIFPVELTVCPTCHGGIKPTRSWTWIDPRPFVDAKKYGPVRPDLRDFPEQRAACALRHCHNCPTLWGDRCGLLWIGGSYYETPADWLKEADAMGVSRRITSVPNDFKLGETWVIVAHRKCIRVPCVKCKGKGEYLAEGSTIRQRCEACNGSGTGDWKPGAFAAFKPSAIDYVTTAEERELLAEAEFMEHNARLHPDNTTLEQWAEGLLDDQRKLWDKLMRLRKKGVRLVHDVRKETSDTPVDA